jgi:hypothetical protein
MSTNNYTSQLFGLNAAWRWHRHVWLTLLSGILFGTQVGHSQINTFPHTESFENGGALPSGWTTENVDGFGVWQMVSANGDFSILPRTGTYMAEFRTANMGDMAVLITPTLDLSSLNDPTLSFYYANVNWFGDIDDLQVYYSDDDGENWTPLGDLIYEEHTSWTEAIYSLPSPSSTYKIAFESMSFWARGFNIDDVTIDEAPTCPSPVLQSLNVLPESAILEWQQTGEANEWEIEYGATPFVPTGVPNVMGIFSHPYELEGLSPSTQYSAYLRANCGDDGTSTWVGPITFTTPCAAITTFPFHESFEDDSNTIDCWTVFENDAYWYLEEGSFAGNIFSAHGGESNAALGYDFFGGGAELVSPIMDLTGLANGAQLTFWYANPVYNHWLFGPSIDLLEVYYSADGGETWDLLPNAEFGDLVDEWTEVIIQLPNPSDNYMIDFLGSTGGGLVLDDIIIEETPACPKPLALSAATANTSATLGWNGPENATEWDVEFGLEGFSPTGIPTYAGILIESLTLIELESLTDYEFYVRADCDVDGESGWSGPFEFSTKAVAPVPYESDFEYLPNYWTIDTNLEGAWYQGTPYNWPSSDLLVYTNVWELSTTSALMSVDMGLVTSGVSVSFDYAFSDYGLDYTVACTGTGSLTVLISTDFGNTYTTLEVIPVPDAGWHNASYDLSAFEGEYVRIRFEAIRLSGDFNIGVDNFYVGLPATCFKPTDLSTAAVTTSSALISWEAPEDGTPMDYQYVLSTINTVPAGAGTSTAGATSAVVGSLVDAQTYYLYVRTDCGGGEYSTWNGPIVHIAGYCIPQYSDNPEEGTGDGDVISNVVIAGTTLSNNSGTASGTPTYVIYPPVGNATATLNAGTSYNISVTNGSYALGGQNVAVWIDFNNNGTFETPSERVGYSTSAYSSGFQTINFPISLPCDPTPGDYRMRVRMVYGIVGASLDPCSFAYYGETEDYIITVAPPPPCPAPSAGIASSITYNSASLSWTAGCTETSWDLHLTTAGSGAPAGIPSHVNVTSPVVLAVLPLTNYEFWVRANCEGDGYSSWSGPFTFNTPPQPPVNDNCATAVGLTVGQPYNGTTLNATQSLTAGTCGGTADDDVWFSFVAPAFPVDIFATGLDGVIELRSGVCNGAFIQCADNISSSDVMPNVSLTEGQTYYIRYYSWNIGSLYTGPFTIVILPAAPAPPANDEPSATVPNIFNSLNTYPNCVEIQGTTAGATPSEDVDFNDVWYRFTAQTNGVSIRLESDIIDGMIEIYDSNLQSLAGTFEDQVISGYPEILNYGDLVPGNQYFLRVGSYVEEDVVDGAFTICLQHLKRPSCSSTATTLCNYYVSSNHTAYSNTFNFIDSNDDLHSYTTTNYQIQLSHPSLGLRYNETYSVNLTSNYRLEDGLGDEEVIQVSGLGTCSVTIADHNPIVVKANQRCTTGAQLARTAVLSNQVESGSAICGATGYRVEFTPVVNCNGDSPNAGGRFERTISAPNTAINLNYAFNHLPEASNPNLGYWSVRWRPRFAGYEGTYGQAYVIAVKKTTGAPAMELDNTQEPIAGVSDMSDISANVYPNPNNGELVNLNITGLTGTEVYVRIMDSMGREVYTNRYTAEGSLNTIVNFTQPLAQGLYMVEFRDGDRVITQRMMVSK